ncbi:uncharacterized protein AMSG_05987 [Thecamonas trahens ATCC 50062]|uniref:Uncharacterized protein n=1 Tax=Thecamonas trahens ATCC 50062 TaxID=461836 RepID=A0A0L0DBV8_THETB|nr:hypothetical protein AMSG_05987 [Thecamonas trahens ATCC 50062]KNC49720.1 hypothetical protein AMSG_05987 [Thecamonas trahens ATCC 50062]|eukprot:XP_013757511.1 hypothetical protein AMSG_05987 [Thecamonas trahens ATCC 50062]
MGAISPGREDVVRSGFKFGANKGGGGGAKAGGFNFGAKSTAGGGNAAGGAKKAGGFNFGGSKTTAGGNATGGNAAGGAGAKAGGFNFGNKSGAAGGAAAGGAKAGGFNFGNKTTGGGGGASDNSAGSSTGNTTAPGPKYNGSTTLSKLEADDKNRLNLVKIAQAINNAKAEAAKVGMHSSKELLEIHNRTRGNSQQLVAVVAEIEQTRLAVEQLRLEVSHELKQAEYASRMTLSSAATLSGDMPAFTEAYFRRLLQSFESKMDDFRVNIRQVESHLQAAQERRRFTPQMLKEIMRNQHEFFMAVAAQVAALHEAMDTQRESYLQWCRSRQDYSNPFDEADERERRRVAEAERKLLKVIMPEREKVIHEALEKARQAAGIATGNKTSTGFGFGNKSGGGGGGFNFGNKGNAAGGNKAGGGFNFGNKGNAAGGNKAGGGFNFGNKGNAAGGNKAGGGFNFGAKKAGGGGGGFKFGTGSSSSNSNHTFSGGTSANGAARGNSHNFASNQPSGGLGNRNSNNNSNNNTFSSNANARSNAGFGNRSVSFAGQPSGFQPPARPSFRPNATGSGSGNGSARFGGDRPHTTTPVNTSSDATAGAPKKPLLAAENFGNAVPTLRLPSRGRRNNK